MLLITASGIHAQDSPSEFSKTDFALNLLLPGFYRIQRGDNSGYFTLPGTALAITGQILTLVQNKGFSIDSSLPYSLSMIGTMYGGFSYAYDTIDIVNRYKFQSPGLLPLGQQILTPLLFSDPEDLASAGIVSLSALYAYREKGNDIESFFKKDSVTLWGMNMPPALAAPLFFVSTIALNTFVANLEEIIFRKSVIDGLESLNTPPLLTLALSSLLFGSIHLSNILIDIKSPTIVTDSIRQAISTTCIGFVLGYLYMNDPSPGHIEGLSHAIRLHFLNNVVAFNINYWIKEGSKPSAPQPNSEQSGNAQGQHLSLQMGLGNIGVSLSY
jgi:membrane protease YdiL (CAAX protease family)